jgi:hypothetical protein
MWIVERLDEAERVRLLEMLGFRAKGKRSKQAEVVDELARARELRRTEGLSWDQASARVGVKAETMRKRDQRARKAPDGR